MTDAHAPIRQTTGRRSERLGRLAEGVAVLVLILKGYRILARRLKTTGGEIDILARRGRTLAVVEVKASTRRGSAIFALSPHQRRRLERAAAAVLANRADTAGLDIRFDVMLVEPGRWPQHMTDAWRSGD